MAAEREARHRDDPRVHAGEGGDAAFKAFGQAQRTGKDPEPPPEIPIAERLPLAIDWWKLVTNPEHWIPTVLQFPNAWTGAIDEHCRRVSAPERLETYPFDRVNEFLDRFNLPLFRELRAMAADAQSQPPSAG